MNIKNKNIATIAIFIALYSSTMISINLLSRAFNIIALPTTIITIYALNKKDPIGTFLISVVGVILTRLVTGTGFTSMHWGFSHGLYAALIAWSIQACNKEKDFVKFFLSTLIASIAFLLAGFIDLLLYQAGWLVLIRSLSYMIVSVLFSVIAIPLARKLEFCFGE